MVIKAEGILKFEIGKLLLTAEIKKHVIETEGFHGFIADSLTRYINCDWGSMPNNEKAAMDKAVNTGGRLIGNYVWKDGREVWIYTVSDRKTTTILFREEY